MNIGMIKKIFIFVLMGCMVLSCNEDEDKVENERSVEQIVDEYKQAVEAANYCSTDAECVIVIPQCPFGCYSAVNIDEEEDITNLARELKAEYRQSTQDSQGRVQDCTYNCMAIDEPVCVSGICELGEGL